MHHLCLLTLAFRIRHNRVADRVGKNPGHPSPAKQDQQAHLVTQTTFQCLQLCVAVPGRPLRLARIAEDIPYRIKISVRTRSLTCDFLFWNVELESSMCNNFSNGRNFPGLAVHEEGSLDRQTFNLILNESQPLSCRFIWLPIALWTVVINQASEAGVRRRCVTKPDLCRYRIAGVLIS
jgi:hypothetical protein